MKHTSGPWRVGYSGGSGTKFSTGDDINCPVLGPCSKKHKQGVSITSGKTTVVMGGNGLFMSPQEVGVLREADARLIAAAPELAEFVGKVMDWKPDDSLSALQHEASDLYEAAIGKAKK